MDTSLAIVRPMALTDAMLIATNVPETDYDAWSSAATYALGERVILVSTHKVYESLQASNTNKPPATEPTWWIEVSATNRWKAFDTKSSTQTQAPAGSPKTISYQIRPGVAVTSVSLFNVTGGTSIRLRVIDPVYGTVYDKTTSLAIVPVSGGWWAWFFGDRQGPNKFSAGDLPSYPSADLYIDVTGTDALALGVIAFGQQRRWGIGVKMGVRAGIQDYSRKETNDFGDVEIVERAYADRVRMDLLMKTSEVDALHAYLATVRATPCVWVGCDLYEVTQIYGFYKSFEIMIPYANLADCELDLEGLA